MTILVADGVENPHNATTLMAVAAAMGVGCAFRDRSALATVLAHNPDFHVVETFDSLIPLVALENADGATSVFDAVISSAIRAVVVGHERRGVQADVVRLAERCMTIPVARGPINTLNVAAAAGVGLYYLRGKRPCGMRVRSNPERHRPSVVLLDPADHVEAGSALRSAAAFGWRSVCVADGAGVWFEAPRPAKTEGRAAARAHRNPLRVLRIEHGRPVGFERVIVIDPVADAPAVERLDLASGPMTAVVIPGSPEGLDRDELRWLGERVEVASLRATSGRPPYRVTASIALTEAMRQAGKSPDGRRHVPRPRLAYDQRLAVAAIATQELSAGDLADY